MHRLRALDRSDFPHRDVSANGAFILGVVDKTIGPHFGTSYSAPIWASVVALVGRGFSYLSPSALDLKKHH